MYILLESIQDQQPLSHTRMQIVYRRAAEVLDRLEGRKGSLKSIIFSKKNKDTLTLRKRVYAVAAETLKCEELW